MAVDDGADIVAIKNGKTYYIQVKTVKIINRNFQIRINENSFSRYSSNDCYYIFVTRGAHETNSFLIFTADDIKRFLKIGSIRSSSGAINISFSQVDSHIYIRSEKIDYAINSFDRII